MCWVLVVVRFGSFVWFIWFWWFGRFGVLWACAGWLLFVVSGYGVCCGFAFAYFACG